MRSLIASLFVLAGFSLLISAANAQSAAGGPANLPPGSARAAMPVATSPRPAAMSTATTTPRVASRSSVPVHVANRPRTDATMSQPHYAPRFVGGASSRAGLSQLPRRTPIQSAPPQIMRVQSKPFETIYREPTISPYLNLYREEDNSQGAPNYHTFVRPYQDQIETNRLQQREIQRLRGQLQGISTTVSAPQYGDAGLPATGIRSRFMDTAQFYGSWQR
jgi:hypothetical protein